ncbi:hypothetical protein [Lacticaseibacillus sp. GG6-2]
MKATGMMIMIVTAGVLFLTGCGQRQGAGDNSASSTKTSQVSQKSPSAYLAHVKAQGLTLTDQAKIAASDLPKGATAGVGFQGAGNVAMQLLTFDTQAQANAAQKTAISRQQRAYTQNRLLLTADSGMGRGWFEKYQHAIFQQ